MEQTSNTINLWEAITAAESNRRRDEEGRATTALGPKVVENDLIALSQSARWSGQEIDIKATNEGWLISVFSCYEIKNECSVQVLIPKDHNKPAQIVYDRNGQIQFMHD